MSVLDRHSNFFGILKYDLQVIKTRGLHAQLVWFSIKAESIYEN